jgi:hypothetical protein
MNLGSDPPVGASLDRTRPRAEVIVTAANPATANREQSRAIRQSCETRQDRPPARMYRRLRAGNCSVSTQFFGFFGLILDAGAAETAAIFDGVAILRELMRTGSVRILDAGPTRLRMVKGIRTTRGTICRKATDNTGNRAGRPPTHVTSRSRSRTRGTALCGLGVRSRGESAVNRTPPAARHRTPDRGEAFSK